MLFKDSKKQVGADRSNTFGSIKEKIEMLKSTLTYFKSDLYLVPRVKEAEFRKKYEIYSDKLQKYEIIRDKMEAVIEKQTDKLK